MNTYQHQQDSNETINCPSVLETPRQARYDAEDYINQKYIEVTCKNLFESLSVNIINKVTTHVDNIVERKMTLYSPYKSNNTCSEHDSLIYAQQKEIEFLREEIKRKDYITELIVNKNLSQENMCQSHTKLSSQTNVDFEKNEQFLTPKKVVKVKDIQKKPSTFTHENRFTPLSPNDDFNDHNDTIVNEHVDVVVETNKIKRRKSRQNNENNKVFVKSFSGATTNCMKRYVEPTVEMKPDMIILHCGTNDLRKDNTPEFIAKEIINLATSIKTVNNKVIISSIAPRNDNHKEKCKSVNIILEALCKDENLDFINHNNINPLVHLNRSRLHLNVKGSTIMAKNFRIAIDN